MDFVHGMGNGKNRAARPLRGRAAREKAVGLRPATRWGRKAPDPMSGFTAYKTRHSLGSYKQRFKPSLLYAFRGQQGGKEKRGKNVVATRPRP